MKLLSPNLAKPVLALAFGLALALLTEASPARAQLSLQAKQDGLQEQLFEFLQQSDYAGALAVVREIRNLDLPVPESVLYAEGLSLLATGRAQEAEWLLANHLEQAGPGSLFYSEIRELHEAARKATGSATAAPAVTGQATGQAANQPSPSVGPSPSEERPPSDPAGQAVRDDTRAAVAQPPSGPLPRDIATEAELENNPGAREWTRIRYNDDPRDFESFVARYPQSRFVPVAEQRRDSLITNLGRRGYESYRQGDYAAARQTWLSAADYGNDYAQTMLGFMYDQGLGVPRDSREALRWFEMAAEQGNVTAQTNLGVLYYEGRGVPQDSRQALEWLLQGAEQGDKAAQLRLGTLYQYGRGNVPQNLIEAIRWFRLAAEQGSEQAAEQLRLLGVP